jgi:hypothetical protein
MISPNTARPGSHGPPAAARAGMLNARWAPLRDHEIAIRADDNRYHER